MTISTGSSYGTSLWLKPISAGTDLVFAGVSASGDGVSFSPSGNKVNVGNPSLIFAGPASAILWSAANQLCYSVNVSRLDASGMPMTSDSSSLTVPFSGSGMTLFGNLSDCQSNISPLSSSFSIAGNQSSASFYMRVTTAGARTLSTTAVGPYAATSYNLTALTQSASHSSLGSRFLMAPFSQKAGLCNPLKITHVNSAGDEIPVPVPAYVKVTATSANVVFFNDPGCTSLLANQSVYFVEAQSSARVYFMTGSSPGSTFTITGSTGGISGESSTVTVATPTAAEEPYMTYSLPEIKSVLLGSHDFATPKVINLSLSPGASVTCEKASGPSFTSWSPCTGQLSGSTFSWNASDAIAGLGFRINLSAPSKPMRSYTFIPKKLYARYGIDFEVLNCNAILAPNGTTDFADINTAQGTAPVVCLEAGTFTQVGTTIITPGTSKILLGKTDSATGNPTTILQAVAGYTLATIATSGSPGPVFANLDIRGAASGGGGYLVNIEGDTGANFKSYNNIYRINSQHIVGIRAHGEQGSDSYGDTFIVDGTTSSTVGLMSTNCLVNTLSTIESPTFKLTSHASTEGTYATAIKVWTSNANLQFFDVKIDPAMNQGSFLVIKNDSMSVTGNVTVNRSAFSIAGLGGNSTRFPIYILREANLTLNGVRIENSMGSDLIRSEQTYATNNLSLALTDTKLINHVDRRVLFVDNSTSGYSPNFTTTRTHFVRASGAGSTNPAIDSISAITWNLSGPQLANPNTFLCGKGAGTNFLSVAGTPPSYAGGFSPPIITNNANVSDLTCQ